MRTLSEKKNSVVSDSAHLLLHTVNKVITFERLSHEDIKEAPSLFMEQLKSFIHVFIRLFPPGL